MRRCLLMLLALVLVAPAGIAAAQEPETERSKPPRRHGDESFRGRMDRFAQGLDREIEDDIRWLREQGLDQAADKVAEILAGDAKMKRILLMRIHRRIQGWQRLKGEEAERAAEEVRLEFLIADLARRAREAQGDEQAQLQRELREIVARQLDLRIAVQQALVRSISKRLEDLREQLRRQAEMRAELIDQRFDELADPEQPLPDPLAAVVPEMHAKDRPGSPQPEKSGEDTERPERRPLRPRTLGQKSAEWFDKQYDEDVRWLRERGLDDFAGRAEEVRQSDTPTKRLLMWGIHRHVQQVRRLSGEDLDRAIEGIKLPFEIVRLATTLRDAQSDQRDPVAEKLREALRREFQARLDTQQAVARHIQRRLDQVRDNLVKQEKFRQLLIERRVQALLDPTVPIPEPQLVPELGGRDGPPERGPRGAEAPRPGAR